MKKISNSSLYSCWPDGFSRYYSISQIIHTLFEGKTVSILDVGGDSQWMYRFLDDTDLDFKLHIIDLRDPDVIHPQVDYTKGDFFKIDRAKIKNDIVINTDVLEHIPMDLKQKFVNRCLEVAGKAVIFSAPQDHLEVDKAEHLMNDLYLEYTGEEQVWLKDHFKCGKPSAEMIRETIKSAGYPYIEINGNNIENWTVTFLLNFLNQNVSEIEDMDSLNRFYNKNIQHVGDFKEVGYRKVFIAFKDPALYEKHEEQIRSMFKSDSSKQGDFLQSAYKKLASTMSKKQKILEQQDSQILKLSKETEKTAQLNSDIKKLSEDIKTLSEELSVIKSSRSYKLTRKLSSYRRKPAN
jgi:hypothetical protein